jgi:formyl-CoA transferase
MVSEVPGFRGLGTPIKLSRTPGGTHAAPPGFAQHTREVLAQHGFGRRRSSGYTRRRAGGEAPEVRRARNKMAEL